ncbi:MAG: outer membrane beta-barrel domain-containing protein [Deltaproteobacteria bacterium]|nr:outer membrane beta-barrel domain-containing protein [Deltaproteobacteria bacterium]
MRTSRVVSAVLGLALAGPAVVAQEGTSADADTSKEAQKAAAAGGPTEVALKPLDDRIKAVQGKKFIKRLRFEIYPWVGVSLNDAFYRYYHGGLAGTFHIMEGLAVEGGLSGAPFRQVLEPVIFLRQQKSAIPADARYFGNAWANLQLSPIYGKMSIFSEWIMHYDVFVLGGAGLAVDSSQWFIHPQLHVGMGSRVFLFDWMVLRGELRGSAYPQWGPTIISNIQNQVTAMFGVGFYVPPFFDKETSVGRRK